MKLPNREKVHISRRKLTDYLLSETHPIGRWKAKFFRALGFHETNVNLLLEGFRNIAQSEDVVEVAS